MARYDPLSHPNQLSLGETDAATDVIPAIGTTPPQILAQEAAAGRRAAAWRLMIWILEGDPRALEAVASSEDDRLAQNLLEFIANGTWAGKPFVTPKPLRSAHARTRLRTLFLPGSGMDQHRAERVLLAAARSNQASLREAAIHILGIMGSHTSVPLLMDALHDPVPSIRVQAAKALGRIGDATAVPALLNALNGEDEQLGSQISMALVQIGHAAVPALIEKCATGSSWVRWQCIRALGEICDGRALPVLVQALLDSDHSVAWMAAKELVRFGKLCLEPVLRLLMAADRSPWLIETSSYILHDLSARDSRLKPYLEPVLQDMRGPAPLVAIPLAAQKALTRLKADKVI
jgi:hypothetical protein